jgi:hypothetical protein
VHLLGFFSVLHFRVSVIVTTILFRCVPVSSCSTAVSMGVYCCIFFIYFFASVYVTWLLAIEYGGVLSLSCYDLFVCFVTIGKADVVVDCFPHLYMKWPPTRRC